jgi:hypothetical protein
MAAAAAEAHCAATGGPPEDVAFLIAQFGAVVEEGG